MARPGSEADSTYPMSSEDDLGRLLRWSLEVSISGAEPPADAWPRILERVRQMRTPTRPEHALRHSSFPLAPLVQAVVISALLLAFGLGVDRSVVMPPKEYRIDSTPTTRKMRAAEDLEDMLRGYMLVRMEQELPTRKGGNIR